MLKVVCEECDREEDFKDEFDAQDHGWKNVKPPEEGNPFRWVGVCDECDADPCPLCGRIDEHSHSFD